MQKRWIVLLALGAAVVAGGLAYVNLQPEPVEAVRVTRGDVLATLTVAGEVRAHDHIDVAAPVTARITALRVDEGDTVHPGQVLALLEQNDVGAAVLEARARLAEASAAERFVRQGTRAEQLALWEARLAEAQTTLKQEQALLQSAQATLADAERTRERFRNLVGEGAISQQEFDQVATRAETAQREVQRLQSGIRAARTRIAQISQQLLEARRGPTPAEIAQATAARQAAEEALRRAEAVEADYVLRATLAGVVTERVREAGDTVTAGQAIVRVANPKTLEVIASVEEMDLPRVRVGNRAYVTLDALPDEPVTGRVSKIGSRVNAENGTVEVTVLLQGAAPRGLTLLPGMTADVNIITRKLRDVMVIPASAVTREGGQTQVWVIDGERLTRRTVRLERIALESYRVLSGLEPGDWVVQVASVKLQKLGRGRPVPPKEVRESASSSFAPATGGR